jgi:hypothetical protein
MSSTPIEPIVVHRNELIARHAFLRAQFERARRDEATALDAAFQPDLAAAEAKRRDGAANRAMDRVGAISERILKIETQLAQLDEREAHADERLMRDRIRTQMQEDRRDHAQERHDAKLAREESDASWEDVLFGDAPQRPRHAPPAMRDDVEHVAIDSDETSEAHPPSTASAQPSRRTG